MLGHGCGLAAKVMRAMDIAFDRSDSAPLRWSVLCTGLHPITLIIYGSHAQECSAVETRTAVFCENAPAFTRNLEIGD